MLGHPSLVFVPAGVGVVLSAPALAHAIGISGQMLFSLGIAQSLGGSPTLTSVLVILTGITGAIVATPQLNLRRVRWFLQRDPRQHAVGHLAYRGYSAVQPPSTLIVVPVT